jgi:cell division septation protein DedD
LARKPWEEWVGSKVCGGYLLRELIGSTGRSAVYLTSHGEVTAALKLVDPDETVADVPQLEPREMIRLYASGACEVDGSSFHYFVMEAADENLASVIASRALSPDEARELLGPLLNALVYLHDHGLAHGRIKPSNILAKGDSVKLSSDSVRPTGAVASPDEDMRALGLTIIEVLTQERQASGIVKIPQPFRDIVEHALHPDPAARWTAHQAAMRLAGTVPDVGPVTVEPKIAAPVVVAGPLDPGPRKRLIPIWVLPVAAVVMLLAIIYVLSRGTGSSANSSLTPSSAAPAAPVNPVPSATPRPTPPPPKPTPFQSAPVPVTKPAAVAKPAGVAKPTGQGWFVVVASYAREADATQEAGALRHRFPAFKLSVFPPSAIDTHYLVIVGSGLSEESAESLRQRAVASGLPPDTYIKRYPSPRP